MTLAATIRALFLDRRGAVAIEFAAIALPLMLLLGGTVEFGRYIWTRHALQDAAAAGARCLGLRAEPCVNGGAVDKAAAVSFVRDQASEWAVRIREEAVTPEPVGTCQEMEDFARVGIRYRFTSILPLLPEMWVDAEACFPVMPSD